MLVGLLKKQSLAVRRETSYLDRSMGRYLRAEEEGCLGRVAWQDRQHLQ